MSLTTSGGIGKYVSGGLGLAFIAAALAIAGSDIERAFRGSAEGRLAWGPALFRVMLGLHGCLLIFWAYSIRRSSRATGPRAPGIRPSDIHPPESDRLSRPASSKAEKIGLFSLILLGLGLRLWSLDSGLWLDEIFMLLDYGRAGLGEVATSFPTQNQHMLYSLLIHIPLSLWGESAWAIRLPAVVFGVATLWPLSHAGEEGFRPARGVWGRRADVRVLSSRLVLAKPRGVIPPCFSLPR